MMKICIVTGTRAEYGLLKPLMSAIQKHPDFQLQLLVTGAHLSPEFGLTYKNIEADGFEIDEKVVMLLSSDASVSIVKSMGLGMIGFADALERLQPDALVILGDRYEMLALASAALIMKIPIVHLHGGEITKGAYDDAIRNAISKMSNLHFPATEASKNRLVQMGEQPHFVHNVGSIGLESIRNELLLSKAMLENELGITFKKFNYQVTFHPETLSEESVEAQFGELLKAIEKQHDSFFIFTKANADTDGRIINQMIDSYVSLHPEKSVAFHSLGNKRFVSVLKLCDAIVGNSSSGIIEAPALGIATINIGNRQLGREQASSIVNTKCNESGILQAFEKVKSSEFKQILHNLEQPYGNKETVKEIIQVLERINFNNLNPKTFFDFNN